MMRWQVGQVLKLDGEIAFSNVAGGTGMMDVSGMDILATITKRWHDYECGYRFHAEITPAEKQRIADDMGGCPMASDSPVYLSEFDNHEVNKEGS